MISYLVSLPLMLTAIFFLFLAPLILFGDGLLAMFVFNTWGKVILWAILASVVSLWYTGVAAAKDLWKGKTLISAAFLYALRVCLITWGTFVLMSGVMMDGKQLITTYVAIILFGFIPCLLFSTPTISLLVCWLIKRRIVNYEKENLPDAKVD